MTFQPTHDAHTRKPSVLVRALAATALACTLLPAAAITNAQPTTNFGSVGWGVQVTPDWVLTAYHFALSPGNTFTNQYGTRVVAERFDFPQAGGNPDFPANDLTLLRLVPLATSAPYLPVYSQFTPDGAINPAWNATIVSAGNTPPGAPRAYAYTTISASETMLDPDGNGPSGPVTVNYLVSYDSQTYVQNGDSAGGLFYGHVLDSSVLLGITSAQYTDENGVPTGSAFVQPAAYRNWIDSTMAANLSDTQMLNWVSSVPEPATWALMAAGAALLAGRRRQRHA